MEWLSMLAPVVVVVLVAVAVALVDRWRETRETASEREGWREVLPQATDRRVARGVSPGNRRAA